MLDNEPPKEIQEAMDLSRENALSFLHFVRDSEISMSSMVFKTVMEYLLRQGFEAGWSAKSANCFEDCEAALKAWRNYD